MSFSVNTGELDGLISGLSGVLGDLDDVGGQIRSGDPGSAGHPQLVQALSGFTSTWSQGVEQLHSALNEVTTNIGAASAAFEATDSAIGAAFRE